MEQQEVNSIMSTVDGVVAMVMDEDEVDAVLVVAVVFVAMTESKTQSVMKRFQVTWSTGLTSWNLFTAC
jgi:formaldehyde-activating enzyme involved in methanogenesis